MDDSSSTFEDIVDAYLAYLQVSSMLLSKFTSYSDWKFIFIIFFYK